MNIFYVYQEPVSFIDKDLIILQSSHNVKKLRFRGIRDIFSIIKGVAWCHVSFCWFGKLHAFFTVLFSKLLRKKSIVIAGGDDVARVPEIKYGMFCYWWKKWCPLIVFNAADLVIAVSNTNYKEIIDNAKVDPRKITLIYHGFDKTKFRRTNRLKKENAVLTIGRISKETLTKKGIEVFVKSAKFLPDVKFYLVGPLEDNIVGYLKKISPPNVKFMGAIYDEQLVHICNQAKVYVQVSIHESFGCSLAEAMLCECIPVISRNGAIPEVVGDAGLYLDELTAEKLAENIRRALTMAEDVGQRARDRIVGNFPLAMRMQQLLTAVETLGK